MGARHQRVISVLSTALKIDYVDDDVEDDADKDEEDLHDEDAVETEEVGHGPLVLAEHIVGPRRAAVGLA